MLDQLRRDITTRLEGLLSEAERLRHALIALGPGQQETPTASAGATARGSRSATASRKRGPSSAKPAGSPARKPRASSNGSKAAAAAPRTSTRTAPGATKSTVLAALAGGDSMTAGEVAAATGLGRATVSTTLSRLAKSGEVNKVSRGYQAARPETGAAEKDAGAATPE